MQSMQLTKTHKIIVVVFTALALFGLYLLSIKKAQLPESGTKDNASTTSTNIPGTDLNIEGNGNYTITQVSTENKKVPKMPDLNRPVTFSSAVSLSDDIKQKITNKIISLEANLKTNPKDVSTWNNLGNYQKMAGDYDGAMLSWKYAGDVSNDFVSYANVGNLYAYYLKDSGMAETYYKKAISRGPTTAYLYIQLASVYIDIFKDLTKANAIIDQGLVNIPNDKSLLETKANLNK